MDNSITNSLTIDQVIRYYDQIPCYFTYFDGERMEFDFYGTDLEGSEVRLSIGGSEEFIRHLSFSERDELKISEALERHIRFLSVTNKRSILLYEKSFDIRMEQHSTPKAAQ